MTQICIVVPVLRRPANVAPLLASVAAATRVPHRVLFVASPGDTAEHEALEAAGAEWLELSTPTGPGDYARKINLGYRSSREPWILTGADDLRFHRGWDHAALRRARARIGVVGTNDLGNPRVIAGRHATHSLVARWYADQGGSVDASREIFHEGYWHEYVDDELVQTAMARQAWAFAGDSIVEHLHPNWGKAPSDAIYAAQDPRLDAGRVLYQSRQHLWGGLGRIVARPTISVIVGTYGDEAWRDLAEQRALASARAQSRLPHEVIHVHGETLAQARNEGARRATGQWLVFLDADDELERRYIEAMSVRSYPHFLLNPAVQWIEADGRPQRGPGLLPERPLRSGNYLVIGTAIPRALFHQAGGFWEEPAWEDWSLFLRLEACGAKVRRCARAVYRARRAGSGRNAAHQGDRALFDRILAAHDAWLAAR